METTLQKILQNQYPEVSALEALEAYNHIELSEEETAAAMLWGKRKKEAELEILRLKTLEEANRKNLIGTQWSFKQTESFMLWRAQQVFDGKFVLDDSNKFLFELLCYYFSNDDDFVKVAGSFGIENASLSKGIFIAGDFGLGKTWLMKLFCKNQRQVYFLRNAKQIADEYQANGIEAATTYENKFQNAYQDKAVFYQPHSGLCIDDLGTENIKKHYGNERNVLADLIEMRYANGNTGIFLHATTNLNAEQIKEYYGGRVASRMREVFNVIAMGGKDRRK